MKLKIEFDNERVPAKILVSTAGLQRNEVDDLFAKICVELLNRHSTPVSFSKADDWQISIGMRRASTIEEKRSLKEEVEKLVTNFEVFAFENETKEDNKIIEEKIKNWLTKVSRPVVRSGK